MAGEICKRPVVRANDTYNTETVKVTKIAAATDTKKASFAGCAAANPLAESPSRLPGKIKEASLWSPTPQQVDTYINSLEHELEACECPPARPGNEYKRTPSMNDRPPIFPTFIWGLLAVAGACCWWLAKIILEALEF